MELSWPCIFKIVSCVSRRSLLIVAAWLIMTYLRNGFLKLSWKASFRDSYRFHWRSVRLWRCTQREKVGSSKAIRSRGDHRLGGMLSQKIFKFKQFRGSGMPFPTLSTGHFIKYERKCKWLYILPISSLVVKVQWLRERVKQWRHQGNYKQRARLSLYDSCMSASVLVASTRDLKIRGRQRQRKRSWKSEFAFFQSSLRLVQVTNFVKCRRTLLRLNSWEPYPGSEREGKFRRRLCTSSVHREIRHFHVVVVQWRQRNVQKSVQNCCFAN